MSRRRGAALVALVVSGAVLLSGCVSLPESGPVVSTASQSQQNDPGPTYYDPPPPRAGASQAQVVAGFLDAMLATPVQNSVAREYLASGVRDSWDPQQTITFAGAAQPTGDDTVSLSVTGAQELDDRGSWKGDLGDQTYTFGLVEEDGQYRISTLPDALIVPETWYAPRYRQVALYFFDPTGQILVPEPVFVPQGEQLASTLVRGLLAGPPSATADFARSFLPPGLNPGLSVPVSADGIADIALSGGAGPVGRDQAQLLLAQLTTTLRQDPSITGVRVTIDGQPLDLPGEVTTVGIDNGTSYAPYVARSSSLVYGLRDGLLVGGTAQEQEAVRGPFGTTALGARAVVPDLTATDAAAVTADGTAVVVGPVRDSGPAVQVLSGATDLLTPVWDFSGRLWLVDRTASGAQVLQRQGAVARTLSVPGVSGLDVRKLLVSRDGSRLVAVVREAGTDRIMVSRILHDAKGRVLRATPATRIDDATLTPTKIRDVAWRTPVGLAVLTQVNEQLFQVRGLSVDGAPGGLGALSTTVKGDLSTLVGSPVPGQTLYAAGPGVLQPLTAAGPARSRPTRGSPPSPTPGSPHRRGSRTARPQRCAARAPARSPGGVLDRCPTPRTPPCSTWSPTPCSTSSSAATAWAATSPVGSCAPPVRSTSTCGPRCAGPRRPPTGWCSRGPPRPTTPWPATWSWA